MIKKEYIAYSGDSFTIEWYYNTKIESPTLKYYEALSANEKIAILRLFKRIGDVGEIKDKTKFNYEGNQIYAFKPHADRFLCFFMRDKKIVITHAFRKKQQKLPEKEKQRAVKSKIDYEQRIKKGTYYD